MGCSHSSMVTASRRQGGKTGGGPQSLRLLICKTGSLDLPQKIAVRTRVLKVLTRKTAYASTPPSAAEGLAEGMAR